MNIYKINSQKKEKSIIADDEEKLEALREISRNPSIKKYFQSLILGYNKNILNDSRPANLDKNRDRIVQWHAKKDQLERILEAANEVKEKNTTEKLV